MSRPALSSDEISERGQALFEQRIRSTLPPSAHGKFLVLDVETGEYKTDRNDLAALRRLGSNHRNTSLYILRIGYSSAYRLRRGGASGTRTEDGSGHSRSD